MKAKSNVKSDLLELLIRECVREVLDQVNEQDDETQGAPAPPAAGQGTADQPAIPKEKDTMPEEPSEKETPPPSPELKGVILVNPRDKSKLQKVPLQFSDDAKLERDLHRLSAAIAGPRIKTSLSAQRMVKDTIRNPNSTAFLYIGKYDPNSDEVFLMADKSLSIAKDASVPSGELTGVVPTTAPSDFNAMTASPQDFAQRMAAQGATPRTEVDERLRRAIKKMVREIFSK